jgi:hypothetical protein
VYVVSVPLSEFSKLKLKDSLVVKATGPPHQNYETPRSYSSNLLPDRSNEPNLAEILDGRGQEYRPP